MRSVAASVLVIAMVAIGCGSEENSERGNPSKVIMDAVAKTEAARTARLSVDISITGPEGFSSSAEGVADFEHDRDLLTTMVQGQTVQTFNDGGEAYVRNGTSGPYRLFPPSEEAPVANNPTDSLKYVGTDVVDVKEIDEDGCYAGKLDFDRVLERAEKGREDELSELRGQTAPVLICVDDAGRISRYDVTIEQGPSKVEFNSTISDHGRAPALEPLGSSERPR